METNINKLTIHELNDAIIVKIERSKRKTIGLYIDSDLNVRLRVPHYLTDRQIKQFIKENKKKLIQYYIKRMGDIEKTKLQKQKSYDEIYYDGAVIPLEGNPLQLSVVVQKDLKYISTTYKQTDENPTLMIKTNDDSSILLRNSVTKWMKKYAKEKLTEKTKLYAQRMGVSFNRISIKEQKTRWGSASSKKNLNFNWKLITMPYKIQDYVVVHELAHLKEMNHSKAFWREVEQVIPDYKNSVKWLKEHGKDFFVY